MSARTQRHVAGSVAVKASEAIDINCPTARSLNKHCEPAKKDCSDGGFGLIAMVERCYATFNGMLGRHLTDPGAQRRGYEYSIGVE